MSITTIQPTNSLVPQTMDQAARLAEMMSKGKLVPEHLRASPGDCLMVIEQAMRWNMSPFAVAQCTSVIQGKLMFEGKLVAAAVQSSGILSSRLHYEYAGDGDARKITVSAVMAGESEPRSIEVRLKDVKTSNGMWTKQPDQQLAYSGTRAWARRYAPEVMLGVYAPEEMETTPIPRDDFKGTTIEGKPETTPPPPAPPTLDQRVTAAVERILNAPQTPEAYMKLERATGPLFADLEAAGEMELHERLLAELTALRDAAEAQDAVP